MLSNAEWRAQNGLPPRAPFMAYRGAEAAFIGFGRPAASPAKRDKAQQLAVAAPAAWSLWSERIDLEDTLVSVMFTRADFTDAWEITTHRVGEDPTPAITAFLNEYAAWVPQE